MAEPDPSGERTSPLPFIVGSPIALKGTARAPLSRVAIDFLGFGARFVAFRNGLGYRYSGDALDALDLTTGRRRWTSESGECFPPVAFTANDVVICGNSGLYVLSQGDGHHITAIRDAGSVAVVNGVLYAKTLNGFGAYDAQTFKPKWESPVAGEGVFEIPTLYGGTVLQKYVHHGPPPWGTLYAYDARSGKYLWQREAYAELAFERDAVYLDATHETAEYFPKKQIDKVNIFTGKTVNSYTYFPDGSQNVLTGPPFDGPDVHVAGGFVYLVVAGNNLWYRYDVDRAPNKAHPVRLQGIKNIAAVLGNGSFLVDMPYGAGIAFPFPHQLVFHDLNLGARRSSVVRSGEEAYVVLGTTLVKFDESGQPFVVGTMACPTIDDIFPAESRVAVFCSDMQQRTREGVVFADASP